MLKIWRHLRKVRSNKCQLAHFFKHVAGINVNVFLIISYFSFSDGTVRLQREVVLLTDDRNLRVKALTRNVPVRDIPSFLSWAKVGWAGLTCNEKDPQLLKPACHSGERTHLKQTKKRRRRSWVEEMIIKNHFLSNTCKWSAGWC